MWPSRSIMSGSTQFDYECPQPTYPPVFGEQPLHEIKCNSEVPQARRAVDERLFNMFRLLGNVEFEDERNRL